MDRDMDRMFNERGERLEEYRKRIATLEAQLEEARKDGERLNYLESTDKQFSRCLGGYNEPSSWAVCGKSYGTLRAAIDAARSAEGGKG